MKKIFALFLISLLVFTGCGKKEDKKTEEKQPQEEIKVNTNENVISDKVVEEFTFTNTSLIYENGTSTLETTVTNNLDTPTNLKEFTIILSDADGNVTTLLGYVGSSFDAHESKVINSSVAGDLTNVNSITYQVVR